MTSPPRHLRGTCRRAEGDKHKDNHKLPLSSFSKQYNQPNSSSKSGSYNEQTDSTPRQKQIHNQITTMSSSDQQQPSLIGGHAQYVKGAAEVRPFPFPVIVNPISLTTH